jgi:tryptophan-rich sensory protein
MFLVLLGLCLAVEYSASVVTRPAIEGWYRAVERPAWTPPDIAFPIVWTLLYIAMATAAWLAWRAEPGASRGALWTFVAQLALNASWSFVFFGLQDVALAFVNIVALFLAILAATVAFAQRSRLAAWLMVPYIAWVGYATALNGAILEMNGRFPLAS